MADYKDMTPESLRVLARKIRYIAEGYEAVADEVESRNLETLSVPGIATAEGTIRRLTGNMGSAQRALADAGVAESVKTVKTEIKKSSTKKSVLKAKKSRSAKDGTSQR